MTFPDYLAHGIYWLLKELWFFAPLQFPSRSLFRAISVKDNIDNIPKDDQVDVRNLIQVDVVPIIVDNVNVVVGPLNAAIGREWLLTIPRVTLVGWSAAWRLCLGKLGWSGSSRGCWGNVRDIQVTSELHSLARSQKFLENRIGEKNCHWLPQTATDCHWLPWTLDTGQP